MQKPKIRNIFASRFTLHASRFIFRSAACSLQRAACCCILFIACISFAFAQQNDDMDFTLDVSSNTIPLPNIFKPNIDLSGRGFHREVTWPQGLAAPEVLDIWQKDIGFGGVYRLQYNFWEIQQLSKDKESQEKLLNNYENIMKKVTDAGGVIILDIFSTPAGLGRVLDKKSAPWDTGVFKELIKSHMKNLSCNKRYNIWYEAWSAPDLDDFFLGRKQEYLNLYRAVAESAQELSEETKIHIPVGGPATTWWFQNFESNTIVIPERSLIYELMKFCSHYHLPLDFITWHAYSTDPKTEKEATVYKKNAVSLIRDWLNYFNFDRNTPLVVDEWNYDNGANVSPEREEQSFICSSFIPSRIKNMYEAGIDYQLYFSLEDFQHNKEGIVRNVGIFGFDSEASEYKGAPKSIYNALKMLSNLGNNMFVSPLQINDEFVGAIATKAQDRIAMLIYNYIDPEISRNYLSRNVANLNNAERKSLLGLIKSAKLDNIYSKEIDISKLALSSKLKALLKKAQELNDQAIKFKSRARNINVDIKNISASRNKSPKTAASDVSNEVKENYLYQRYVVDSSCSANCKFTPVEEKDLNISDAYHEALALNPYSLTLIILSKKPKSPEPENATPVTSEKPATEAINNSTLH